MLFEFFFFVSVPPEFQIEDVGKTQAPLKTEMLTLNRKTEYDVETWVYSPWVKMKTSSLELPVPLFFVIFFPMDSSKISSLFLIDFQHIFSALLLHCIVMDMHYSLTKAEQTRKHFNDWDSLFSNKSAQTNHLQLFIGGMHQVVIVKLLRLTCLHIHG